MSSAIEKRGQEGFIEQVPGAAKSVVDIAAFGPRLLVRLLDDLHTLTQVNAGLIEEIPKLRRQLEGLDDLGEGLNHMGTSVDEVSVEIRQLRARLDALEGSMNDLQGPTESLARSLSPFS